MSLRVKAMSLLENAKGNYAYSDHACVALIGVENLGCGGHG